MKIGSGRALSALALGAIGLGALGFAAGPRAAESADAPIAIVGATVFDATGAAPHPATVVIAHGRIADVGPDGEALLPGFFDVHTHWTPGGQPATTPQIANAYIASGVTTTNDFNAAPESWAPRRAWIASLASPHVNMTARMGVPGGHGADWADAHTIKQFSTPESARAAMREVLAYQPDMVKGFHDGWRYGSGADNNTMDLVTLSALADEAHKAHLKVLTHTVTVARGKEASRAKVDVVAHSLQDAEIDQQTVDLFKANGTAYAPTLAVYEPVKPGQPPRTDDTGLAQSKARFEHALHNLKRLHDAGVLVALGTDAGMPGTPHGVSSLHEMELMTQAGLTPTEALMAGTANSARALGLDGDRGTIEKGKRADLVLIKGAPWSNIADVRKTDRTFVDGKLVYGPGAVVPVGNAASSLAPVKVAAKIDDFERADGRTDLDTLQTDDPDGGSDRSVEVTTVIDRGPGDHALSVAARMSHKANPSAGVILPLTRGSIQPADLRAYHGVRFEIRGGAGTYSLAMNSLTGRWSAPVAAGSTWRKVEVPFSELKWAARRGGEPASWRGDDLVEVELIGSAPAGQPLWWQIDNVEFY
ncbi:MAG: amidohydrolase family protein [Proteobacteria bacterium]|nr:amidohydrolase family protein [Pseudomonadota bacterium]